MRLGTEPPDIPMSREIDPKKEPTGEGSGDEYGHLPKGTQGF